METYPMPEGQPKLIVSKRGKRILAARQHSSAGASNPRRNAERKLYRAMRGKVRVRKGGVFARVVWSNPKAKMFEAVKL